MVRRDPSAAADDVALRDVTEADLPIFFAHQRDPAAVRMAAFPAREREAFIAHWTRILGDATTAKQTILVDGEVAGHVVGFGSADRREIGYWIGRDYWGKGVATRALAAFLEQETIRPLYAHVAKQNAASLRVLEKCGFAIRGEEAAFADLGGETVAGYALRLDAVVPEAG